MLQLLGRGVEFLRRRWAMQGDWRAHAGYVDVVLDLEPEALVRLLAADLAEDFTAAKGAEVGNVTIGETNRWILADVLGDAGGFTDGVAQLVAEDAGCGRLFGEGAGAASEVEGVVGGVLFGVEHVGATRRC